VPESILLVNPINPDLEGEVSRIRYRWLFVPSTARYNVDFMLAKCCEWLNVPIFNGQ
jgi:hypothetical protein